MSAIATTSTRTSVGPWVAARRRIVDVLAATDGVAFARLGLVGGALAEIDRLVTVSAPLLPSAAEVVAFAAGDRSGRGTVRLFRVDDDEGTVGVLVGRARTPPERAVIKSLVDCSARLIALLPERRAELVLDAGRAPYQTSEVESWSRWHEWRTLLDRSSGDESLIVHHGAVARVERLFGGSDDARLLRVERAQRASLDPMAMLTPSQRRVVSFAAAGATIAEIARALDLSTETVRSHVRETYRRLGIASRAELAALVVRAEQGGTGGDRTSEATGHEHRTG